MNPGEVEDLAVEVLDVANEVAMTVIAETVMIVVAMDLAVVDLVVMPMDLAEVVDHVGARKSSI